MNIARACALSAASIFTTIFVAVALLSGCGTGAILDRDARDPGDDESIVVFKASPSTYRPFFFAGSITDGSFKQGLLGAEINGLPKDGYIVAKVKAGQTLGLTTIVETKENNPSGFGGTLFKACGGARALVFEVPRSRVAYLTDIEYQRIGNSVSIQYQQDLEAARAHIRANYPEIRRDIQPLNFQILPIVGGCSGGGTAIIPIYIHR